MPLKDVGARFVVQGEGAFIASMGRGDAAMDKVGAGAARMGVGVKLGLTAAAAGATALGAGLLSAVQAANTFETSFAGVRKTVDGTPAELDAIKQAFIAMSLAIPVNVNELNRIGEAAGQLGVAKENLIDFTQVAAEMGVATNLSSDEAATSMARLANIVQLPQEQFRNLGSAVVDLGNHSAATESEILNMALRLAGAGNIIGLTTPQILGMATALSSVGIEAESGGTAFSRVFVEIANNVKSGGEVLDLFAAVANQTTAEFKESFEKDAAGAIIAFVRGLDTINKSGGNVFETLEALELGEIRVRDALLRSAGAGDILEESVRRGSDAWAENSALADEANKKYETTESKLILAANAASEAQRKFGEELQPAIGEAADAFTTLINQGLIPIIDTHGPLLNKFLTESAQGWKIWANAITGDAIPAMDKATGTAYGLLNVLTRLPGPLGMLAQGAAGIADSFSGDTRSVSQSGYRVNEELRQLEIEAANTALELERLNEETEWAAQGLGGAGEAAEVSGVAIAGWGGNVANAGAAAAVANPRIKALTDSLLGDSSASKAASDAKKAEAEARREAAEAARLEAERLEQLRLAREKIVNEIGADVLRNQAGVSLNSTENPRMEDFNLGVEALDKITSVGGDASVALALLDKTMGEFSGVLSTLGGEDLANAGAVMEGFHRLKAEFEAGRITAVEYVIGLRALEGQLGTFTQKALDAAAAQEKLNEDTRKAMEERAFAETDFQNRVLTELSRIEDEKQRLMAETTKKLKEEAAERAKVEIDAANRLQDWKDRVDERDRQRELEKRQRERDEKRRLLDAMTAFGATGADKSVGVEDIPALLAISKKYGIDLNDLLNKLDRNAYNIGFDPSSIHIPTEAELFGMSLAGLTALPTGVTVGNGGGGGTTFNVTANYSDRQEPQSIAMDLEAIAMAMSR